MKKEEIKAVIFDVGGVLYLGKKDYYLHVQKKLKLNPEEWKNLNKISFRKSWSKGKRVEEGLGRASKKLGIKKSELKMIWENSLRENYRLNTGLLSIVKKLRKNYKTALLSNQWKITHKVMINKNILKIFDVSVFSHIVKSKKPEKKIYLITLKRLKLKPKECIFVDDQEITLKPAKKLGMKTILYKNNLQLIKDLKKHGVIKK